MCGPGTTSPWYKPPPTCVRCKECQMRGGGEEEEEEEEELCGIPRACGTTVHERIALPLFLPRCLSRHRSLPAPAPSSLLLCAAHFVAGFGFAAACSLSEVAQVEVHPVRGKKSFFSCFPSRKGPLSVCERCGELEGEVAKICNARPPSSTLYRCRLCVADTLPHLTLVHAFLARDPLAVFGEFGRARRSACEQLGAYKGWSRSV